MVWLWEACLLLSFGYPICDPIWCEILVKFPNIPKEEGLPNWAKGTWGTCLDPGGIKGIEGIGLVAPIKGIVTGFVTPGIPAHPAQLLEGKNCCGFLHAHWHTARPVVVPGRGWIERPRSGHRGPRRSIHVATRLRTAHPWVPTWQLHWIHRSTGGAQTLPGSCYHCSSKRMKCGGNGINETWQHRAAGTVKTTNWFSLAPKTSEGFAQPVHESTWHHGMWWKAERVSQYT